MTGSKVAAHLIVGEPDEPFLPALLESLAGSVDELIVNDNSAGSKHENVLHDSWFGRNGRLHVDRSPFADFSTARNHCLDLHERVDGGAWIAFVDADEVHGSAFARLVRNLREVWEDVDFIDGYTWHFFQSFDLYTAIERRMMFFRFRPGLRWHGKVHEQLDGLSGARVPVPYVYAHYGHVLPPRRHAEKGRRYSSLGQSGATVPEDRLDAIDPAEYFKEIWPFVLRFSGEHPAAARSLVEALRRQYAREQAQALELVRRAQPPLIRARNLLLKLNYEQRWRSRALNPQARRLLRR